MDGFKYWHNQNLITVWSAPNYCYRCNNVASILKVNVQLERQFEIFTCANDRQASMSYRTAVPYFL
jgi:hypothetical protein